MKQNFFQDIALYVLLYLLDTNETLWEKARWDLQKKVMCCFQQIQEATTHKAAGLHIYVILFYIFIIR